MRARDRYIENTGKSGEFAYTELCVYIGVEQSSSYLRDALCLLNPATRHVTVLTLKVAVIGSVNAFATLLAFSNGIDRTGDFADNREKLVIL